MLLNDCPVGIVVFRYEGSRGLKVLVSIQLLTAAKVTTHVFVFPRVILEGDGSASTSPEIKSSSEGPEASLSAKAGLRGVDDDAVA